MHHASYERRIVPTFKITGSARLRDLKELFKFLNSEQQIDRLQLISAEFFLLVVGIVDWNVHEHRWTLVYEHHAACELRKVHHTFKISGSANVFLLLFYVLMTN